MTPFATVNRPDLAAELRRAADLAHEALGLAWAAEAAPPLLECLTDLAELLDQLYPGRAP